MANKLTAENIEAAAQHLENIQTGKTPILGKTQEETNQIVNQVINKKEKRVFPLIPPNDPRLLMQIAPFMDDTLENFEFANRKELCEVMYDNMADLVYQQIKSDYHIVCLSWADTHRLKMVKFDMFLILWSMM